MGQFSGARSRVVGYAVAVGATVVACLLRRVIDPWLGERLPFLFSFFAIVLSVTYGGFRAGLLSVLLGFLLCRWFFIEPRGTLVLSEGYHYFAFTFYVIAGLVVVWVTDSLRRHRNELQAELQAARRFHDFSTRLLEAEALPALLQEVLDAAIEITHADMGNIQLLEEGELKIAAQRGFQGPFLEYFGTVHEGNAACGSAFAARRRIVVEDVASRSDVFDGPTRDVMLAAAARAVQSTPLVNRSGSLIGIFSTHYRRAPHRPDERELRMLDLLARHAADLIERHQAEMKTRASELRLAEKMADFEVLMNTMPIAVCYAEDAECQTIHGNPALYDLLRMPVGANISKSAPAGEPAAPYEVMSGGRKLEPHELPIQRAAATGRPLQEVELELVFPDGDRREIYGHAVPLFDRAGKVRGGLLAFVDITARKQAEQRLHEADRRKDVFMATLAHELRNPLAPIQNAAAILKLKQSADYDVRWAAGIIDRHVKQMARLLDDLLDVSRITRDRLELRTERLSLANVLNGAVEAAQPLMRDHGHELALNLPEDPIIVEGDSIRLIQVFSNLLTNAAKYMDRGGQVWLSAERQGDDVIVSVKDSGIGIAAEALPRIFEMFSQVGPVLDRSAGGLGIGLSLVRGLVELHGGQVEAHSDGLGRGAEFIVHLPACIESAAETAAPVETVDDVVKAPPLRVLVADDWKDSADSLALTLKLAMGHHVQTAYDGQQAIEAVEQFRPDVAFLDIGMPRLNGYEVAQQIRETTWGRKIVLIALTGWGQDEDRRRATEAGFDGHLLKPADTRALRGVLEKIGARS